MGIIYKPQGRAAEYASLAINHYVGCSHGCKYCYVPDFTHNPDFHRTQAVRKNVLERLQKEAPQFAGTDERVLLCFACDPYQPLNVELQITRQVIEILKANNLSFQVLTKGGMRAVHDFDLYGPGDAFATTLTFLVNEWSRCWEPNAALPADRIEAIIRARDCGIETWVSLEPVIDPLQTFAIIKKTHEFVNLFRIGKLNHHNINIDWREFGKVAIELCRQLKANYVIKKDLAAHLDGIPYVNCPPCHDYCPLRQQRCMCWDQGCQAEQCVIGDNKK